MATPLTPDSNTRSDSDRQGCGVMNPAHDALNRMKRAHARGTGCRLSAEMVASLGLSFLGELWAEDDPRGASPLPQPPETHHDQHKG